MNHITKHKFGEKEYKLILDFNAICLWEDASGQVIADIAQACRSIYGLRSAIWAALQRYHAEQFPDQQSVSDFLSNHNVSHVKADNLLGRVYMASFGSGEAKKDQEAASPSPSDQLNA